MSKNIIEDVIEDYEKVIKILQNRIIKLKAEHNISSSSAKPIIGQQRDDILNSIEAMRNDILTKVSTSLQGSGTSNMGNPAMMPFGMSVSRNIPPMPDMSDALKNVPEKHRKKIEEQMKKTRDMGETEARKILKD